MDLEYYEIVRNTRKFGLLRILIVKEKLKGVRNNAGYTSTKVAYDWAEAMTSHQAKKKNVTVAPMD